LPVRLIGSPFQRNDIALAHDLIDDIDAENAIADRDMMPTISSTGSPKAAPRSLSRPSATERFGALTMST
jgi:hypothetical protein